MRTAITASIIVLFIVVAAVFVRFKTLNKDDDEAQTLTQAAKSTEKLSGLAVEQMWEVPTELKEISGIAYLDEQRLACVQDEKGSVFIFNIGDQKIEREIPFGNQGDYEDLAIVENNIYVLRADGRLFSIENFSTNSPAIKEHNTRLTGYEFEGLCYDKSRNRLLLAVKEETKGKANEQSRPVFAFDLANEKINTNAVFTIALNKEVSDTKEKSETLKPSAMAIHPETGEIYVLEGAKPKLLVLDPGGKPHHLRKLKGKEFIQPEGLAFSPGGTLFIANEGSKKKPGNILRVRWAD